MLIFVMFGAPAQTQHIRRVFCIPVCVSILKCVCACVFFFLFKKCLYDLLLTLKLRDYHILYSINYVKFIKHEIIRTIISAVLFAAVSELLIEILIDWNTHIETKQSVLFCFCLLVFFCFLVTVVVVVKHSKHQKKMSEKKRKKNIKQKKNLL